MFLGPLLSSTFSSDVLSLLSGQLALGPISSVLPLHRESISMPSLHPMVLWLLLGQLQLSGTQQARKALDIQDPPFASLAVAGLL